MNRQLPAKSWWLQIGLGRKAAKPVNQSSPDYKENKNWLDIKDRSAAFAVAKA
jgi:hypothetical protein